METEMSAAGDQREPFSQVFSHLEKVETFAIALGAALLVLLAMFSVSMGIGSGTFAQGFAIALRAFSVCVATVFAAGATGALLGFLFGIPRLLQRPGSAQSQSRPDQQQNGTDQPPSLRQLERERFFSSNTSFEEISDWLTKIIIGLGLVQFQTILGYLRTASLYTASYINESPVADNAGNLADGKIAVAVTFCLIVTSLFSACLITWRRCPSLVCAPLWRWPHGVRPRRAAETSIRRCPH
ncbi:MAG: hypothetical protein E5W55_03355 [Mesorhizobium sp.]|nr:MAG: hypothetical protein E5W55_03355 [Mesorhizobium sp.]